MIKVSIVTVVYNGEDFLEETILSVINQTYKNIEYIIIDGGSTDSTLEIIKKYEEQLSYWVSEEDNGIYDAMNKGIEKANGDLIGIINADDWYNIDTVANIVNNYLRHNKPDILFGNMQLINENTNQSITMIPSLEKLNKDMSINHPTCFVKKELYQEKMYSTHYHICGDYDLILYFYNENKSFKYINKNIANMRIGGISDNFLLSSSEVMKIQKYYYGYFIGYSNFLIRLSKRLVKKVLNLFISETKIEKLKGFN